MDNNEFFDDEKSEADLIDFEGMGEANTDTFENSDESDNLGDGVSREESSDFGDMCGHEDSEHHDFSENLAGETWDSPFENDNNDSFDELPKQRGPHFRRHRFSAGLPERLISQPLKKILIPVGAVCVVLIVIFCLMKGVGGSQKTKVVSVLGEIQNISKLETLEYDYTMVSNMVIENKILFIEYDTQSIYTYSGTIVFGIDCSKVDIEEEENKIIVTLPEVEILSSAVDSESYNYILDAETSGSDFAQNQAEDMRLAEEAAIAQGCENRALENAEEQLERLILYLKDDPAGEVYEVEFIEAESDTDE